MVAFRPQCNLRVASDSRPIQAPSRTSTRFGILPDALPLFHIHLQLRSALQQSLKYWSDANHACDLAVPCIKCPMIAQLLSQFLPPCLVTPDQFLGVCGRHRLGGHRRQDPRHLDQDRRRQGGRLCSCLPASKMGPQIPPPAPPSKRMPGRAVLVQPAGPPHWPSCDRLHAFLLRAGRLQPGACSRLQPQRVRAHVPVLRR